MRRAIGWAAVVGCALAGLGPAAAGESEGQVLARDGSALEDLDYRFRLRRPASDWTLLPEERAREVVPDAVAGGHGTTGHWFAVIVEHAPGASAERLRETVFENIGAEGKQRLEDEAGTLAGVPCWNLTTRGEIEGVPIHFRHVIAVRGEFAYQLICWTPAAGAVPREHFAAVARAFAFLEGDARARRDLRATRDQDGIGWRVREGAFESGAYRLRVKPPEGWRVVVASELLQMNDDAEVGLAHAGPEAYVVVIPELYDAPDPQAVAAALAGKMEETYGEPVGEGPTWTLMGQPTSFRRHAVEIGTAIEFFWAVRTFGRIFFQVLAWTPAATGTSGRALIEQAVASIQVLDDEAARVLSRALDEAAAERSAVGPEHALRRGRYQHFGAGFALTTPPGYWRLRAGQEARAVNEAAELVLEDPERGLTALLILDPELEMDDEAYHHVVVEGVWEEQTPPEEVGGALQKLGGATARSSAAAFDGDGLPMWYRVTTFVHRGTGIQVHVFGHTANRDRLEEGGRLLLKGLELPAGGIQAVVTGPTAHEDHRLGFRFRTQGLALRLRDQTPAHLAPLGTVLVGQRKDEVLVMAAVHGMAEGQDQEFFLDLIRGVAESAFSRRGEVQTQRREGTFAGQPCVRLGLAMGEFQGNALLVQRGRFTYLLMHGRPGDAPLDPELEQRLEFLP